LLACIAYAVFLRSYRAEVIPARDRHIAPALAVGMLAISTIVVAGWWVAYSLSGVA
jgi:hypothetical protein